MLWYGETARGSKSETARGSKSETEAWPTGGLRNALLAYPEEALFSRALCEHVANPSAITWQQLMQGEPAGRWQGRGAGPDEEVLSPVFPRDAMSQKARHVCQGGSGSGGGQVCEGVGGGSVVGFQAHWRWGGVLVTVPRAVLERVNGFPEDPGIGLFFSVFSFVFLFVFSFVVCGFNPRSPAPAALSPYPLPTSVALPHPHMLCTRPTHARTRARARAHTHTHTHTPQMALLDTHTPCVWVGALGFRRSSLTTYLTA
jgi:hypothetical protein